MSDCPECIWQPVLVLTLVTTEGIVGNGWAKRLETWALVHVQGDSTQYRTSGENKRATYFCGSLTVYIYL